MTGEIAAAVCAYVFYHEVHLGFDASLKSLFEDARQLNAGIVVTLDSVSQNDPDEIPKLIERLRKGNVDVVGSRLLKWEGVDSSRTVSHNGSNGTDFKAGFRAYSERAVEALSIVIADNGLSLGNFVDFCW